MRAQVPIFNNSSSSAAPANTAALKELLAPYLKAELADQRGRPTAAGAFLPQDLSRAVAVQNAQVLAGARGAGATPAPSEGMPARARSPYGPEPRHRYGTTDLCTTHFKSPLAPVWYMYHPKVNYCYPVRPPAAKHLGRCGVHGIVAGEKVVIVYEPGHFLRITGPTSMGFYGPRGFQPSVPVELSQVPSKYRGKTVQPVWVTDMPAGKPLPAGIQESIGHCGVSATIDGRHVVVLYHPVCMVPADTPSLPPPPPPTESPSPANPPNEPSQPAAPHEGFRSPGTEPWVVELRGWLYGLEDLYSGPTQRTRRDRTSYAMPAGAVGAPTSAPAKTGPADGATRADATAHAVAPAAAAKAEAAGRGADATVALLQRQLSLLAAATQGVHAAPAPAVVADPRAARWQVGGDRGTRVAGARDAHTAAAARAMAAGAAASVGDQPPAAAGGACLPMIPTMLPWNRPRAAGSGVGSMAAGTKDASFIGCDPGWEDPRRLDPNAREYGMRKAAEHGDEPCILTVRQPLKPVCMSCVALHRSFPIPSGAAVQFGYTGMYAVVNGEAVFVVCEPKRIKPYNYDAERGFPQPSVPVQLPYGRFEVSWTQDMPAKDANRAQCKPVPEGILPYLGSCRIDARVDGRPVSIVYEPQHMVPADTPGLPPAPPPRPHTPPYPWGPTITSVKPTMQPTSWQPPADPSLPPTMPPQGAQSDMLSSVRAESVGTPALQDMDLSVSSHEHDWLAELRVWLYTKEYLSPCMKVIHECFKMQEAAAAAASTKDGH